MDIIAMQKWSYLPDLPDDISPIRRLLIEYSNIQPEDINNHILRVREDAWKVSRYPCIGRWKFLRLNAQNDPCHQQVIFRLNVPGSNDAFLDLGCCVGQVLRQLRHDGVQGSQLFGTDVHSKFIDIGYDLFRDQATLGATFVIGDMLDPDDTRLDQLLHKVTMIYAGSFFHLFSWTQQVYIGKRLVGFLKQGTKNALIYGRQVGSSSPGVSSLGNGYLHDMASFQRLWDEIGNITNSRWSVELEISREVLEDLPQVGKDVHLVRFTVYQIS